MKRDRLLTWLLMATLVLAAGFIIGCEDDGEEAVAPAGDESIIIPGGDPTPGGPEPGDYNPWAEPDRDVIICPDEDEVIEADEDELLPGDPDLAPGDPDLAPGDPDLAPGDPDLAPGDPDLAPGDPDGPFECVAPDLSFEIADQASPNAFQAAWAAAPDNIWAVGVLSQISHYDGSAWDHDTYQTVPGTPTISFSAICGSGPDDIWAMGDSYPHHWNGTAWEGGVDVGLPANTRDCYAAAPNSVYAATSRGIWHYDGTDWTQMADLPDLNKGYNAIFGFADNDIVAAGVSSIIRWDGATWTDLGSAPGTNFYAAWGFATDDIWFSGHFSAMYHWTGTEYEEYKNDMPGGYDFDSLSGACENDVYTVTGEAANQFIHQWTGTEWRNIYDNADDWAKFLDEVLVVGSGDVWVFGQNPDGNGLILHAGGAPVDGDADAADGDAADGDAADGDAAEGDAAEGDAADGDV